MPETDVAAPSAFQVEHDSADNAYLLFGSNSGDTIRLYYLGAGASTWQQVIDWPALGRLLAVSPAGKVYAVSERRGARSNVLKSRRPTDQDPPRLAWK